VASAQRARSECDSRTNGAISPRAHSEPNVFYEPAFVPGGRGRLRTRRRRRCVVWSGHRAAQAARIFFRAAHRRAALRRSSVPLLGRAANASLCAARHALLEREAAEQVIAAWLAHLRRKSGAARIVAAAADRREWSVAAALNANLNRAQLPAADFARQQRALLEPGGQPRALHRTHALLAPPAASYAAPDGASPIWARCCSRPPTEAFSRCRSDRGFFCA